jgi:hypothetical protein
MRDNGSAEFATLGDVGLPICTGTERAAVSVAVDVSKGEGSRSARGELRRSCAAGSVRGMSGYVIRDPGNQLSELMESGIR